jgi:hypothetical protein
LELEKHSTLVLRPPPQSKGEVWNWENAALWSLWQPFCTVEWVWRRKTHHLKDFACYSEFLVFQKSDSVVFSGSSAMELPTQDLVVRGHVWLVTFAAVLPDTVDQAAVPLRTLEDVTREQIRDAVLDAVANPARENPVGGRPGTAQNFVEKLVVFLEEPRHFHVALKLSGKCRFVALARALRLRSGLASHWSHSHTQWWSAVRYGTFATEKKPQVDNAPLVWAAGGRELNLFEEAQEPWNAQALKRRREQGAVQAAAEAAAGKKTKGERFTSVDFKALVLAEHLTTPSAVMEYVQLKGSAAMLAFVSRHQSQLKRLLAEADEWSRAQVTAAAERESGWQLLHRLAASTCACSNGEACQWSVAAQAFFQRNVATIDQDRFAACLAKVVQEGPGKKSRVPLLAGVTNAGKSTVLDPIDDVFGSDKVFHTPALGASMPLANLATGTKRFIYFDEYQPVTFAANPRRAPTVPAITFMKLFAGQSLEIQVPLNANEGNIDFSWKQGAAITCKLLGLWDPQGCVGAEDVRHTQSRVEQFEAHAPVLEEEMRVVPRCKESFAKWLTDAAASFAHRTLPILPVQVVIASHPLPEGLVAGLSVLVRQTNFPPQAVEQLNRELLALGAIDVAELSADDWRHLPVLDVLRPLERRRFAAFVGFVPM